MGYFASQCFEICMLILFCENCYFEEKSSTDKGNVKLWINHYFKKKKRTILMVRIAMRKKLEI